MSREHSSLEKAVLQTVAYVDMFDYPLTVDEIHRYLVACPASRAEVEQMLANGHLVPRELVERDGFFALPGRLEIVETRLRRAAVAQQLWPAALQYGRLIAALPYVRMVALTGSLAVDNAEPDADIDYLVVTENGRLWLCRAMVILIVRLAARRGVALCPNYFLSERALVFEEKNLYTAHELAQMVPLAGLELYREMRRLNPWVHDFLPNASTSPPATNLAESRLPAYFKVAQRLVEIVLRTPLGGRLEKWEMRRKVRKFSRYPGGGEAAFSSDWCKGHFDSHGKEALEAFNRQWQEGYE